MKKLFLIPLAFYTGVGMGSFEQYLQYESLYNNVMEEIRDMVILRQTSNQDYLNVIKKMHLNKNNAGQFLNVLDFVLYDLEFEGFVIPENLYNNLKSAFSTTFKQNKQ